MHATDHPVRMVEPVWTSTMIIGANAPVTITVKFTVDLISTPIRFRLLGNNCQTSKSMVSLHI